MRALPSPLRWLLLLLVQHAVPSLAELTAQEAHECRANPELIAFELRGGWVLEIASMFCVALFMYVLIEEYYVPALELICTKEVLNIPKPIMGCTIMAAGNCLPELSISLMSILANGQDIGTGEVLGSCVFDLLAMLGVVCIKLPKEGARMPLPLVLYFLAWVVIATTTDLLLFFTTAEITWFVACVMVLLYVLFCAGVALLNALFDLSDAGPELSADPESQQDPWNQHDPMEPAPKPSVTRDTSGRLSAERESSLLLKSPHGAGASTALTAPEGSGRTWERRASECWGGLHTVALAPPRFLFTHTVPKPGKPMVFGRRLWPLTVFMCILYTLALSFTMVAVTSRSVCLLGVRKNALGATALCFAAGLPDLITVVVLCNRPGMHTMAASNAFGAFAFNAFVALGLPWVILGTYSDIFPPAKGTWFPAMVGFSCCGVALLALLLSRLELRRNLGVGLLLLYVFYLVTVIHDGMTRIARPPE